MTSAGGPLVPTLRSLGPDLYAGTSGIALFLAEYSGLIGSDEARATAEGALAHAMAWADQFPDHGFFSGRVGVAYVSFRIGNLFGKKTLARDAVDMLVDSKESLTKGPLALDVISGLAGIVPVLLEAAQTQHSLRSIALSAARVIVERSTHQGSSWRWDPKDMTRGLGNHHMLTGLSHGASGIAAALLAAFKATGEASFRDAALGALDYENSWFVPEQENWPDLRSYGGSTLPSSPLERRNLMCGTSWCHGAPGIALVLANSLRILGPVRGLKSRFNAALRTTAREIGRWRHGSDVSPCHGLSGLLECYASALSISSKTRPNRLCADAWSKMLRLHRNDEWWPSGVPSRSMNPSLMLGMAGVGYHLLRSVAAERIPSVLLPTIR